MKTKLIPIILGTLMAGAPLSKHSNPATALRATPS